MARERRPEARDHVGKDLAYYLSLDYPIEIRQSAVEEGTWIATIPFLGAATFMGVGDTREEALAQLDEARSSTSRHTWRTA